MRSPNQPAYDYTIFIGRFQPFHNGHLHVVKTAQALASKKVILLVGSSNSARTFKNPFTFEQRKAIIEESSKDQAQAIGLEIIPLSDSSYDNEVWIESVQQIVRSISGETPSSKIALIGHIKDASSQYLTWFPQWDFIPATFTEEAACIDATTVRNLLFEDANPSFLKGAVPDPSYQFLINFKKTSSFPLLKAEYELDKKEKEAWAQAPAPPVFVMTTAVVLCSRHVLMVKRESMPGKGLWSLPEGPLEQHQRMAPNCTQVLRRATYITLDDLQLQKMIRKEHIFESPGRSLGGRALAPTYLFALDPPQDHPPSRDREPARWYLPSSTLGDDSKGRWIAIGDLPENQIYADHYAIIHSMVRMLDSSAG